MSALSALTYSCMHCQSSVVTCSCLDRVECLKAQGWSKQKRGGSWRCGRCTQQVQTVVVLPPQCQIAGTHGIVVQPIDLPLVVEERLTHLEAKVIYFWGGLPNPGGGFPGPKTTVTWTSPGGGGYYPESTKLEWDGSLRCVKQMARLDFMRGTPADDNANIIWDMWTRGMPNLLRSIQMAGDAAARPQWMEAMVGVCYHTADGNRRLSQHGCDLEIWPHSKVDTAVDMWFLLEGMGLRASDCAPVIDRRGWAPPPVPFYSRLMASIEPASSSVDVPPQPVAPDPVSVASSEPFSASSFYQTFERLHPEVAASIKAGVDPATWTAKLSAVEIQESLGLIEAEYTDLAEETAVAVVEVPDAVEAPDTFLSPFYQTFLRLHPEVAAAVRAGANADAATWTSQLSGDDIEEYIELPQETAVPTHLVATADAINGYIDYLTETHSEPALAEGGEDVWRLTHPERMPGRH